MKRRGTVILALTVLLAMPLSVYGNMAAPRTPDVGTAVTFQKNEAIAVLSENLTIEVHGASADIVASYRMKNTSEEPVTTPAMFLSPNIQGSGAEVSLDGEPLPVEMKIYGMDYDSEVGTDDWQYVTLHSTEKEGVPMVDSVTFTMDFAPGQEREAVVAYEYRLGGYPDYTFNAKDGIIEYYLTPAAMWKDFENLTIDLYLDEDMPVIKGSSLEFQKVGQRTYQYVSDTLPEETLWIRIDENWVQNIFSTLRSPYLRMNLVMFAPILFIILLITAFGVWQYRKRKGKGGRRL